MTRGSVCINLPGAAIKTFLRNYPPHQNEVAEFDTKLVATGFYVSVILLWPPSDIKWLSYTQLSETPQ